MNYGYLIFPLGHLTLRGILACFTCWIAREKGHNGALWFAVGFLLPQVALFYVMLLDDKNKEPKFPDPRRRRI